MAKGLNIPNGIHKESDSANPTKSSDDTPTTSLMNNVHDS